MTIVAIIMTAGTCADPGVTYATLLIPALTTGAGVATIIAGQNQCDNVIVVGTVDTANPLQGLQVEIGGTPFINITNSAAIVGAFAKWINGTIAAGTNTVVGLCFRIATGLISKNTKLTFTNNGSTTPSVYSYSDGANGAPFMAATNQININSNQLYEKFSALIVSVPANLLNADVIFRNRGTDGRFDGTTTKSTLTPIELAADYIQYNNNAEAGGLLNGCLIIDNRQQRFQSIKLYTASTAVNVCTVALPQAFFNAIKRRR